MNTHKTVGQGHALVITGNFVEAADVSEALSGNGFSDVTHCRDARIALDTLTRHDLMPDVSLVSFKDGDPYGPQVLDALQAIGCKVVIVNGDPTMARNRGLAFLQRPFSDGQIQRTLQHLLSS